jgi:hypothetical protein
VQTIVELAASLLGVQPAELEAPDARLLQTLLLSPSEQVRDLQEALRVVAGGQGNADSAAVRDMTAQVCVVVWVWVCVFWGGVQRLGLPLLLRQRCLSGWQQRVPDL